MRGRWRDQVAGVHSASLFVQWRTRLQLFLFETFRSTRAAGMFIVEFRCSDMVREEVAAVQCQGKRIRVGGGT
eukprot:3939143-Rhodomonas_salina.5